MKIENKPTTIEELRNYYPGGRGLWIGSGPSSAHLLRKRTLWFDCYDFILCANESHAYLTGLARSVAGGAWWICIESTGARFKWFYGIDDVYTQLCHHRNWIFANAAKAKLWMDDGKMISVNRNKHLVEHNHFNPRDYALGLHSGEMGASNIAKGTVTMQVMHLACYMGASHLDMTGVEFCAVNDRWHFYERMELSLERYEDKSHFVEVELDGKTWLTHEHFVESPPYIDKVYKKYIEPAGMTCARFCPSLLREIPYESMPA